MKKVVITHGVRTPIGRIGGMLKDISSKDLSALILRDLVFNRSKIESKLIDYVILGEVRQSFEFANVARLASLKAGLDQEVSAYTVHRQCGSGLQSIMDGYTLIANGEADVIVAGGVENMSQSSYYLRGTENGLGNGNYIVEDSLTAGGPGSVPESLYGNLSMGDTAENLALKYKISREEQDFYAHESQLRANQAINKGYFKTQILDIEFEDINGWSKHLQDEHPFLSSIEKLNKLQPVFKKEGSVTAGNSSGRNDGAAAILMMTEKKAKELGYHPLATILGIGSSGCEPKFMGLGPVRSSEIALKSAELNFSMLDIIELNEAFSSQTLAVISEWEKLGISKDELLEKINPNGGAIALGHPLGCTGAVLTVKCLYELERVSSYNYGMITLCCAGGQGVSLVIESTGDKNATD